MSTTLAVRNTDRRQRHGPAGTILARQYGRYYLAAERRQAIAHARQVATFERQGRRGAWKLWQDFVDHWDVSSLEREYLNACFDIGLADFEGEREHDPDCPDGC